MKKKDIKVIVNLPNEDIVEDIMARIIAEIVMGRVNRFKGDRTSIVEKILKEGKCEGE
ncbi:hypothetical protein [Thermohalobacter berrensis]|uniref:hypothetical protein n=1 Tax=Thermohalobacter berrensis TaxID=99594 RepID=UPI0016036CE8|nr:hypothetical protein [Thermohalobacter berrensis]